MLGDHIPGEAVSLAEAQNAVVTVKGLISKGVIREVRLYSGKEVIAVAHPGTRQIDLSFPLSGLKLDQFIRVEVEGDNPGRIMISTPFFLEA